jgi:hypothetical protein
MVVSLLAASFGESRRYIYSIARNWALELGIATEVNFE